MTSEQTETILNAETTFWAMVEVVGRRTHYGRVSMFALGGAALLRVDIPPVPEMTVRERGYFRATDDDDSVGIPYGLYDVTYPAAPAETKFIGIGSIYELTPMDESIVMALRAKEVRGGVHPIKVVRIEAQKVLGASIVGEDDRELSESEGDF